MRSRLAAAFLFAASSLATAATMAGCGTLLGASGDDATPEAPLGGDAAGDTAADAGEEGGAMAPDADAATDAVFAVDADAMPDGPAPACEGGSCDRFIFVTNERFDGNLGGVAGADAKCQTAGNAFMPGRSWKAWIGTANDSVTSRFAKTTGSYVNGFGPGVVAQGWSALASAVHQRRIMDESNQPPPNDDFVWTGTTATGLAIGVDCSGWTSDTAGTNGKRGNAGRTDGAWSEESDLACDQLAHLYCVEQ